MMLIDGLDIHYQLAGEGPLLVLLHGWGANCTLFRQAQDFLSASFTTAAPDMPGFGKTPEPDHAYDLDDYVNFVRDFVLEILRERGALSGTEAHAAPGAPEKPKVLLLGHSHGGRCTLRLLSRLAAGEEMGFTVEKAVLVGAAGLRREPSEAAKKKSARYRRLKKLLTLTHLHRLFPGALDALQKRYGSADYAAASPVMRQSMVKVVNTDLRAELPSIRIPVLLIWGEQDTETPLSDGKTMEELMPEAGLATIAGAGHYCFLEQPVLFQRILASFLTEAAPTGGAA